MNLIWTQQENKHKVLGYCVAMLWPKNYLTDQSKFWKNVKSSENSMVTNKCNTVNGVSGDVPIAEMWKVSFEKLYNMHSNNGLEESIIMRLKMLTSSQMVIYVTQCSS